MTCSSCDRELAPDARFCDGCGTPVGAPPPPTDSGEAVRKTVTALFCDLVGSTAFGERVDAESTREAMGRYHAMARTVIESHEGSVAKFIGDGVMALFGVPEVSPDDADRAVLAGLALQAGFAEIGDHIASRYGVEVGLRVGINTGEVVIAHDDADIVGDALNIAARLEAACEPGHVLVGETTYRLTRGGVDFAERGTIEAKGKDEPVTAFEVVAAHAVVDEADELATPFVGREDELRRLRVVLEDAILERRAALVSVIGSPGVGKTRLAREMRASVQGGTGAFELRCERSGTTTFAPIAELLRSVAGITDAHTVDEMTARVKAVVRGLDDAERVSDLLCGFVGAGPMRSTEEMFLAVRRLFEVLGAEQPVVLVVDDIQWAEPLFLDLLEHLAEWVQTVPLLVVCLARPEIREVRPALTEAGRRVAEVVNLEGLSIAATGELAARLVGADSLPRELLARIPESTEGNPLFVRELMRMLVDDGVISDASGRWEMVIDVEAVEVPPTINSLLASRVERMSPEERRVLELASVVGSEFPIGALEAAGDHSRGALEAAFERLRRKELIEPTGSYWGDEPVYRFHHVLIRDAAYRRLLKGARAELHLAVGEWTEQTASALVGEHEVTIAHHFEQAYRYRLELDLDDKDTKDLGERAARLLHLAAARALEREDLAAAASLASRALGCVDDDDGEIAELLLLGCEAVLGVGNLADGAPLVERLAAVAGDDTRLGAWVDCFRVQVAVLSDPEGLHDAELLADDAARRLEELGDSAGVAKARIQRAGALVRLARVGECETELDLALSAARAVDDRRRVTAVLGNAPIAALWGPSPVPRAGGRCLDVVRLLRITTGSPAVEATSIRCQAVLEALRGRYDTARAMLANGRSSVEELGLTHDLLETEYYAGIVELLADEPAAAEPLLRAAHDGLGRMGIGADRGQAGAHLARALLLLGRLDEAEELALESRQLAGQNLQTALASRSVHAEILSARGRHDEALALADEAVAAAAGSDILVDHANAVASQARVRAAAGDSSGATAAAAAANALYERKGSTLSVDVGQFVPAAATRPESPATDPADGGLAWNEADRASRQLLRPGTTSDDWLAGLADDVVFDDRRSLISGRYEGPEAVVAGFLDGIRQFGDFELHLEPIAVRGEDFNAFRGSLFSRVDRSVPAAEWISVNRWQDGLLQEAVLFDGDDYAGSLVELDRLYAATLDPILALRVRELAEYEAAAGRGDVDTLRLTVSPDLVAVDNRAAAWPRQGRDEWVERLQSLLDVAPRLNGVAERIHEIGADHVLFTQVWRFENEAGGEHISRFLSLSLGDAAEGLASRVELFEVDDLDRARSRLRQLLDERSGEVAPNLAAVASGRINACVRGGRPVDDCVVDASRLDTERHAFGVSKRRLLVADGDQIVLVEAELDDGTWVFSVEEVDQEGRLVDWRLFAADELREAVDHEALIGASVVDDPAATTAAALATAMRSWDRSAVSRLITEDFHTVDHRSLSYPSLSREEFLGLVDVAMPGVVLLSPETFASGDGVVLASTAYVQGRAGALTFANVGMSLLVADGDKASRIEVFGEADLDAAMARFRELTGRSSTSELVAAREADVADEARNGAEGDTLVEGLSAELVNAATIAFGRAHGEAEGREDGDATVIAVRGDDIALIDLGDVEGPELLLVSVDEGGRAIREERFRLDDQTAALARLEEWFVDSLGADAPAAHETLAKFVSAYRIPDREAMRSVVSADIRMVNHGSLVQVASFAGAEEVVSAIVEMAQAVDSVVEKVHRHSDQVVLVTLAGSVRLDSGERWGTQQLVVVEVREQRISLVEMWDRDDLQAAVARYDELTASAPAMSIAARQFDWLREGYETGFDEAIRRFRAAVSPDHRLEYRQSGLRAVPDPEEARRSVRFFTETGTGITGEPIAAVGARWLAIRSVWYFEGGFESERYEALAVDADGLLVRQITVDTAEEALATVDELRTEEALSPDLVNTATMVIERDKADGHEIDVIAVRGDEHALVEVISGSTSELRVVTVAVDGTVTASTVHAVDELATALQELDVRYVEGLGEAMPLGLDTFAAVIASLNPPDPTALAALFADDIVSEDHVALNRIPGVTGRDDALAITAETNTGVDTVATKVHRVADHVIMVTIAQSDRRAAGERWTVENPTVAVERDGSIVYFGSWDPVDIDAAAAKFDELAGDASPSGLRNRAAASYAQGNDALARGDLEGFRSHFHPEARILGHRHPGSSGESTLDEYIADIRSLFDSGVGPADARSRIVAVRGEQLSLEEQRVEWGDRGSGEVVLTLREVDGDGLITHLAHFEPDDLVGAHIALEERFRAGEGARFAHALGAVNRTNEALNRRDVDQVMLTMADDFVLVDQRTPGWGTLDRAGTLDRVRSTVEMSSAMRSVHRIYHRICHDAALIERVVERTDSEGAETRSEYLELVLVRPDGRATRTEHYGVDDLDAAVDRYDELTGGGTRNAAARTHHDTCLAFFVHGDVDATLHGWTDDVVIDDRRAQAQVRVDGAAQNDDVWRWTAGSFQSMEFECLATFGGTVALCRLHLSATRRLVHEQHVLTVTEVDPTGKARRTVMFDVDQIGAATACFDELAAEETAPAPPPSNATTEAFALGVELLSRGDLSGLEANDPDLEFHDNLRLPWPDGGLPEATAMLESYAHDGWTWSAEPVAVVEDRFAVLRAGLHAPDGDDRLDLAVSLVLAESGLGFSAVSVFEPEELRLAFADCRRRWLDTAHDLSPAARIVFEAEIAANEQTRGHFESLVSEGCVFADHRPGSVLDGMDGAEWAELQESSVFVYPHAAMWARGVIREQAGVVLARADRWSQPAVAEPDWTWLQLIELDEGRLKRLEVFDPAQLAEAEARFAELAGA